METLVELTTQSRSHDIADGGSLDMGVVDDDRLQGLYVANTFK